MATGTIPEQSKQQLDAQLEDEQNKLQEKREKTGNPNWQPQGGDHGSGLVPEEIWKKNHPESKEETAV